MALLFPANTSCQTLFKSLTVFILSAGISFLITLIEFFFPPWPHPGPGKGPQKQKKNKQYTQYANIFFHPYPPFNFKNSKKYTYHFDPLKIVQLKDNHLLICELINQQPSSFERLRPPGNSAGSGGCDQRRRWNGRRRGFSIRRRWNRSCG